MPYVKRLTGRYRDAPPVCAAPKAQKRGVQLAKSLIDSALRLLGRPKGCLDHRCLKPTVPVHFHYSAARVGTKLASKPQGLTLRYDSYGVWFGVIFVCFRLKPSAQSTDGSLCRTASLCFRVFTKTQQRKTRVPLVVDAYGSLAAIRRIRTAFEEAPPPEG